MFTDLTTTCAPPCAHQPLLAPRIMFTHAFALREKWSPVMTVALHSNGVCSGGAPLETPLPSSLLRGHTLTGKEGGREGSNERKMQKENEKEGWRSLKGRLAVRSIPPATFILVFISSCTPAPLVAREMEGSISVVSVRGHSPPCPDGVLTTGQMAIPLLAQPAPPSKPPQRPHLHPHLSTLCSGGDTEPTNPPSPISTCSPDWAGAQSEAQALLWLGSDPQAPLAWAAAARRNAEPGLAKLELIRMCGAQEWPPPASL
ncbi:unnamed protein product [Leuciscus chuanchicus]